jgi:drug/metabolite transporter (DMT)-like permease
MLHYTLVVAGADVLSYDPMTVRSGLAGMRQVRSHPIWTALPLLALLTGAIFLGSSPLLVRLSHLEPTATAFFRVLLAAPAFLIFPLIYTSAPANSPYSAPTLGDLTWLMTAGGLFALDLLCLHWSLRFTSVAKATLFLNFAPFFVALGAWAIFGEVPTLRAILSVLVAIVGVALLVGAYSSTHPPDHLIGDVLGILAGAAYGGYLLVVSRFRHRMPTSLVMGVTTLSCAAFLLPAVLAMGESLVPTTAIAWALLLALALVTHAGGQGLLVFAMRYLPAGTSSVTLLLQPVVAAYGAWLLFAEKLGFWQLVGGCIVLAAIALCHDAAFGARGVGRKRPASSAD